MNARHLTESAEHYTPPTIVESARRVLGAVDLDPFSCGAANAVVGAATYFAEPRDGVGAADPLGAVAWPWERCARLGDGRGVLCDGFAAPWRGRVLCNPPGGKRGRESAQCAGWEKAAAEWVSGRASAVVFVCFSLELLQVSQASPGRCRPDGILPIPLDFPVCYPARRIAYWRPGPGGGLVRGSSPPHSSCVVLLPQDEGQVGHFAREFGQYGRVVVPATGVKRAT